MRTQLVDGFHGAGSAHVAQNQRVGEIIIKILVNGTVVGNGRLHGNRHMLAAFEQPVAQTAEQTFLFTHGWGLLW